MKLLILGATGMLGHKLIQVLSQNHNVFGTVRKRVTECNNHPILNNEFLIGNVFADKFNTVEAAVEKVNPEVVINCIGIIKQLPEAHDPVKSIALNSLFPHLLAQLCNKKSIRLIHYSTDCVFSGKKGNYLETDFCDADDLYGRTKLLGELTEKECLTIRTSLIGRELTSSNGLIEWFLSQNGKTVKGYKNAIFSGLTTNAHARVLERIILDYPDIDGLYHLAGDPISKFDLLHLVKKQYNLNITIEPDWQEFSNRSLNASKFKSATKIIIPCWSEMLEEMHKDSTIYNYLR